MYIYRGGFRRGFRGSRPTHPFYPKLELYCIVLNLCWLIKRYIYKKATIKLKWRDGETNPLTAGIGLTLKHIQVQSLPIV